MLLFRNGDRVECIEDNPDGNENIVIGSTGTVLFDVSEEDIYEWVQIRWDNYVEGHNCNGRCTDGYGWSVPREYVQLSHEDPNYEDIEIGEDLFLVIANG